MKSSNMVSLLLVQRKLHAFSCIHPKEVPSVTREWHRE